MPATYQGGHNSSDRTTANESFRSEAPSAKRAGGSGNVLPMEQRIRQMRKEVEKALQGKIPVERAEDVKDPVRFHENHRQVVKELEGCELDSADESVSHDDGTASELPADGAAAAEKVAGTKDAALLFTKVMWFRSRSPE